MTAPDKERIVRHLFSVHAVSTKTELLNKLQDCGLIADGTVTWEEFYNSPFDLMNAYNASIGGENRKEK